MPDSIHCRSRWRPFLLSSWFVKKTKWRRRSAIEILQMTGISEQVYHDIGSLSLAAGLPDKEAISKEEAYIRAYMALEQRCGLQQGLLLHSLAHTSRLIPSIQNGRLTLFAMTVRNTTRPPSLCTPMTAAFVEYNMKCRMSKGGKSQ